MSVDAFVNPAEPRPVVAVCGGAVAGSEAAALCAERGALVIVFEQGERPYGKIEDGLPRWHEKLRQKEYHAIDSNLTRQRVLFVPKTRLGDDISFESITREWGLSATIMAHGAWRDRPLPVPGVERFVDRGLAYQNPLVYWFNHYVEPGYRGPQYEIPDGTVVVGGGLASIDVVKIINLELYGRALRERGVEASMIDLEVKGIPTVCEKHGIDPASLGIKGVTLCYRRRKQDMPLATMESPTPEQMKKLEVARAKIMDRVIRKYLVGFEELASPVAPIADGDRLGGLVFRRNQVEDGRLRPIEGSEHEVRSDLVVSSIGSIPEPIEGIPMEGELYRWHDRESGVLMDGVYGLGNVLTGKGNIKDSRTNAQEIVKRVADFLGVGDGVDESGAVQQALHRDVRSGAEPVVQRTMAQSRVLPPEQVRAIFDRVRTRWEQVGYDGDYARWMERVGRPV